MGVDSGSDGAKPKVLFVTYNFPPKLGGLEQVVLRVWESLRERAEVTVLAQYAGDGRDDDPMVLRPRRGGLLNYFAFLYSKGRALTKGTRFDFVVSGSALTAMPVGHLARRCGGRSAAIIYGLDTIYPSAVYQAMYRRSMPRMDRVIAISRATREEAVARGVSAERVVIVPPGCDPEPFLRARETEGLCERLREAWGLEGAKVILSAGRLVRRKGVDRFVGECLPRIVAREPKAKLLVAGGNPEGALAHRDDMLAAVWRAADEAGVREHVAVTGRLSMEDMAAAFGMSEVFVLPVVAVRGDMEGFGIVLLEAGAAGMPVVASRLGGVPDAVVDGVTGILTEPGDYGAMAEGVLSFLCDGARREAFGEAGRRRTVGEFAWSVMGPRFAEAILGETGKERG